MIIRSYHEDDLAACRQLWTELTQWHRDIYDSPTIGGDNPGLGFDTHLGKVGAQRIWVGEDDGQVVGMAGLQPGTDEGTLEVEPLVVSSNRRGEGTGQRLIQHLIGVIKELGLSDFNVRVTGRNAEAIQFYHDAGFDTIGYIELMHDTRNTDEQPWRDGETVAERSFRV